MHKLIAALLWLVALHTAAWAPGMAGGFRVLPTSTGTAFTATALYYMSPTGSDAANGLTPATAWATANHAVNCGDVIIAAEGTYNGNFNVWGAVSSCPSTTGGIDGSGGIYAATLLCSGDLGTNGCLINCSTGACATGAGDGTHGNAVAACMQMNKNNWSVQGWQCNGNGTSGRGFQADTCLNSTQIVHHVALINNLSVNNNQAFGGTGCLFSGTAVPGNGYDYWAIVGNISQNAAQDGICLGALDFVGNTNFDTNSGTHLYAYGNFIYASTSSCGATFDTEAMLLDTPDGHNFTNQVVFANNITWLNFRYGIQLFFQNYHSGAPTVKIYNNTFFNDLTGSFTASTGGEINFSSSNAGGGGIGPPWVVTLQNNIARQTHATPVNGGSLPVYGMVIGSAGGGTWGSLTDGGSGNQNIILGAATSSSGGTCDSGSAPFSECVFNGNGLGTNTITDPLFNNTSDLLSNWTGLPNCTTFASVTACMGYNTISATLTSNTPISDLRPSCAGCGTKGYQLPNVNCTSNADFPTWLKGLVRLQWHSATSSITQEHDLVTTPCGL